MLVIWKKGGNKMFHKIKIYFFSLLVSLMMISGLNVVAVSLDLPSFFKTDSLYSVVNTKEWKMLGKEDRVAALQFTDDELRNLSDDELVYAVVTYPFFIDIRVSSSSKIGFEDIYPTFTALKELTRRGGLVDDINNLYVSLSTSRSVDSTYDKNAFYMQNIEVLVAQPIIYNATDTIVLSRMYSTILEEIESFSQEMNEINYDVNLFKNSLYESGYNLSQLEISTVPDRSALLACTEYWGSCTYATVYTPNGSDITVIRYINDFTATYKAQIADEISITYPNAVLQSNATPFYNCHSYAWYSATTSNRYWMNDPSDYMSDGSYIQGGTIVAGMKIHYATKDHSGIVTGVVGYGIGVKSKWGAAGLYTHQYNDSPYGTGGITFWHN